MSYTPRRLYLDCAPNTDLTPVPVRSPLSFPVSMMCSTRSRYPCSSWNPTVRLFLSGSAVSISEVAGIVKVKWLSESSYQQLPGSFWNARAQQPFIYIWCKVAPLKLRLVSFRHAPWLRSPACGTDSHWCQLVLLRKTCRIQSWFVCYITVYT